QNGAAIANGTVVVQSTQTAGNGGNGTNGALAGNGGNAFMTNVVGGLTTGNLTLAQTANAGNGGNADTLNGGNGGNAASNLTLDQTALPLASQASTLTGTVTANGGI